MTAHSIEQFLVDDPTRHAAIAQLKAPLKDAEAVNATRWALCEALADIDLPVEASCGGRPKYNGARLDIVKTDACDAARAGGVGTLIGWQIPTLAIKATGRGANCRTTLTAHGFPRGHSTRAKSVHGFQTGDMLRAGVSKDKKAATCVGRVAIRASGAFTVQTPTGVVQGINARHCMILHRTDGYKYQQQRAARRPPACAGSLRADFR